MGVVKLEAESVIASIVEAMLPRFSDKQLGLLIGVDMDVGDNGYGKDGNTRERKELHVRQRLYFLFQRPSNYTKVLFWQPKDNAVGWDCSPAGVYAQPAIQEWHLESDHDSCWRDAVGSKLTDAYFKACARFDGRKITGDDIRPCDLYQFMPFTDDPKYRFLEVFEQKDKKAEKFSNEGRTYNVKMRPVALTELEAKKANGIFEGGFLVKGSEDHKFHMEIAKLAEYKQKELQR